MACNCELSFWSGMTDGDETTVDTPFGDAVFMYQEAGLLGGMFFLELTVGDKVFDLYALEPSGLTAALNRWAETQ